MRPVKNPEFQRGNLWIFGLAIPGAVKQPERNGTLPFQIAIHSVSTSFMNSLTKIRLLQDMPESGPWNMALDEALLKSVGGCGQETDVPVLRYYYWNEPTLSLGYFQSYADRDQHAASREISMVRRNSGGGAIIHDLELTYSITVPESSVGPEKLIRQSRGLYAAFHDALIEALAGMGIQANKVKDLEKARESNFLCFQRRAPHDVLINGQKVCGSAQRKKFGAISQHGSVILKASPFAPEIPGIADLSGANDSHFEFATREQLQTSKGVSELSRRWLESIGHRLRVDFWPSNATEKELKLAQEVQNEKFSAVSWNQRR